MSDKTIGPLLVLTVLLLAHCSYVGAWFKRGGIRGFWSVRPASVALWISRISFLVAVTLSVATIWLGRLMVVGLGIAIAGFIHFSTLGLIDNDRYR